MLQHVIWRNGDAVSTITVGRGLQSTIVDAARERPRERVALLFQPSTADIAEAYAAGLGAAGFATSRYEVPDGEGAKRLSVVEDIYRFLNKSAFTRDDLVVGLGGGALTDVAGFVGATYLRGVPVMYVATTLVAAVDAAIGGKTGVNVDGKNLAGVFSHPEAVVIDIDILDRLPVALKREGAAEALKAGFIEDMRIVVAYESEALGVDLEEIVNWSVAVKVDVVNEDFLERGRRSILNYGHTVGHAIESITGWSHGDSIAIGMVAEGAASREVLGFTGEERQRDVLREVGLPLTAPGIAAQVVRSQMQRDKKRDAAGLRMILLQDFASPKLLHVDDATVQASLDVIGLT